MCGVFVPFHLEKQMGTGFGFFSSFFLQAITSRCIHQSLEGVKKPISVQAGFSLASSAIEPEHYLSGIVLIDWASTSICSEKYRLKFSITMSCRRCNADECLLFPHDLIFQEEFIVTDKENGTANWK